MDFRKLCSIITITGVIALVCHPSSVTAGDIVNDDNLAPKKPGCENDFVLVTSKMLIIYIDPVLALMVSQPGFDYFLFSLLGFCVFCLYFYGLVVA